LAPLRRSGENPKWAEGGPVSEAALSDRRPLPPCAAPVFWLLSPVCIGRLTLASGSSVEAPEPPYFSQSSKL
jgi:hypothetical protein